MKKKLCAIILILVLALNFFTGCTFNFTPGDEGGGGQPIVDSGVPNYDSAKGKLGFMTYSVPLPTDEQFQLYKEAGLRTMLMDGEYLGFYQGQTQVRDGVNLTVLEEIFRLADKYGIEILDRSMDMATIVGDEQRQAIYDKYPDVLKGFFIGDEPGTAAIDDMARYVNWVNENYPKSVYTTTLHPSWAPYNEINEGGGKQTVNNIQEYYEYMINEVLSNVGGQKILCADDYPCKRYGFCGNEFLNTLLYMSLACKNNPKIIKQMCLNCSTFCETNESTIVGMARPEKEWQGAYEKEVTEMEIRMPAITSLAFGFKSFLYFMYGPFPWSDQMEFNNTYWTARDSQGNVITKNKSPIDYVSGSSVNVTEYYDYVKNTNLEFESFEKCYTSFNWYGTKMISQSGIYKSIAETINDRLGNVSGFSALSSYSATGNADVMIGYFKQTKPAREGYFVSNFCGYTEKKGTKMVNDHYPNAPDLYQYTKNATVTLKFNNYDNIYLVKNGVTIKDRQLINHALTQELKPGDYMFVIPY